MYIHGRNVNVTQHREKIEIDFSILKDIDIDILLLIYIPLDPIKEKERKNYYFTY